MDACDALQKTIDALTLTSPPFLISLPTSSADDVAALLALLLLQLLSSSAETTLPLPSLAHDVMTCR